MKLDKLTCRFLTEDELPRYIKFCENMTFIMKQPLPDNFFNTLVKRTYQPNKKHVAVFDENDEIISVLSATFSDTIPFWYITLHYIKTDNNSLSSHMDYIEIFNKSIKLLTDYGEQNGYYGFYIRRILSHQEAHEKLLRIAVKRGAIQDTRYDYLYEKIYSPEESTRSAASVTHKIFFSDSPTDTPTVIVLYSLKQQFRKELLLNKHADCFKQG